MSLKVIELNDRGIKVGDESGIIVESPGFALAVDDKLEVGESAEQQARLRPTNSFSKYWHDLSLEPISHSNKVRHFADLAYAQLMHLADAAEISADVIFAVPGNFTRQQLAILLGLAQQCPFTPIGVVDSALAAAVGSASAEHIVYADIQLHQVVLSKVTLIDQHLNSDGVIQIPGVGSQNFMNLMMQIATDMFIQQCRFNPQHNAESEQQLYNELPSWLLQDEKEKTLLLELKSESAVHTAKLPRESLLSSLNEYYKKINEQISALVDDSDVDILLSQNIANLPGFLSSLKTTNNVTVVTNHAVNEACHQNQAHITSADEGIHLVNVMPFAIQESNARSKRSSQSSDNNPTHALYANRAIAIDKLEIKNRPALNGNKAVTNTLLMDIESLPESLGQFEQRGDAVYLKVGVQQVFLNDNPVTGEQVLKLGDRIQFEENGDVINLIQVNNG
jgi:hypothetical protein